MYMLLFSPAEILFSKLFFSLKNNLQDLLDWPLNTTRVPNGLQRLSADDMSPPAREELMVRFRDRQLEIPDRFSDTLTRRHAMVIDLGQNMHLFQASSETNTCI